MGKIMEVFEKTFVTNVKRIGKVIAKFYNIPLFWNIQWKLFNIFKSFVTHANMNGSMIIKF